MHIKMSEEIILNATVRVLLELIKRRNYMADRTALDSAVSDLVAANQAELDALAALLTDTTATLNALLAKIAAGSPAVDYAAEVAQLQAQSQKNSDALSQIQSADAVVKTEGQ